MDARSARWIRGVVAGAVLGGCGGGGAPGSAAPRPPGTAEALAAHRPAAPLLAPNPSGVGRTFTASGEVDTSGPFFQVLGTNGRSCSTCHDAAAGWSSTPAALRQRFDQTDGTDPIFRPNDGATSPRADVSTVEARRRAYALLLAKALIRVGMPIPDGAEFELVAVDDPYGYASASELSLFRRTLPSANLDFLSAVMWDGRETLPDLAIADDLAHQANSATQGHAQRPDPLGDDVRAQIVAFERQLFFAQALDQGAGKLDADGARGGPVELSRTEFHLGINDPLGGDPSGAPFDPDAMTLFSAWSAAGAGAGDARAAIARGEALFDRKRIAIRGVRGLNDTLGLDLIEGSCTTCHDAPNVGDHSVALPLDLGLADASRRTPDLPLYTLRNKATGETFQTTDPGRALVTGKWKDLSRFKGPILRGLAARPPYFHNGAAATLEEVVQFYQDRFSIGLSDQEKADLAAFLRAL